MMSERVPASSFPALGFDPAPGDPAGTLTLARTLGMLAGEVRTAAGTLTTPGSEQWTGEHADAFRAHLADDVVPLIKTAAASFEAAANALAGWSRVMEIYATEAAALERRAETTRQASPSAAAKGQAAAELAAIRRQALRLNDEYVTAAARVASQLIIAQSMAPRPPGLFDSLWHDVTATWDDSMNELGDWVRSHVAQLEFVASVLNMVATIAGFLALIPALGLIFGMTSLIAAGLATADDLLVASFAGGSWVTVGLDATGMLGGMGSYVASGKLVKIFEETGRTKQMWKVLSFGKKEVRVVPGLFRSIAHMTDADWVNEGRRQRIRLARRQHRVRPGELDHHGNRGNDDPRHDRHVVA
jgi:hypothetical protein